MKELNNSELMKIDGGSSTVLIVSVIAGVITFVTGILSGYSNPQKCN